MSTRAAQLSASVNALACKAPRTFGVALAAGVVAALAALAVGLAALLSGPIGVELKGPFWGTSLSRLRVVQMAIPLGFVVIAVVGGAWRLGPRGRCWRAPWQPHWEGSFLHRQCSRQHPGLFWLVLVLAAVLVNVAMLVNVPVVAFVEPDTLGYLRPSALRSGGYMMILKAVLAVSGDLNWIVPLQLNVMVVSFAVLGGMAGAVLRSQVAGLIVALVPMLSSGLLILAPTVMTEAFFVALICFHMAAVLSVFRRLNWINVSMVGLTLGLMIVIRPNGISFLAGVLVLVFFFRARWRLIAAGTIAPVVVLVMAQGIYHQQTFGFFGLHKFGGISLAGAAAPLIKADMETEYPDLAAALEQSLKDYYVDFGAFEKRTYPFEIADAASQTAVGAIYGQILPAIRAHLGLPTPRVMAFEYDPRINAIAGALGLDAIRSDPWGFVKIVTSNYIENWFATLPIRVPMAIFYPRSLEIARQVAAQYGETLYLVMNPSVYSDQRLGARIADVGDDGLRWIEAPRLIIAVFQLSLALVAFGLSVFGLVAVFKYRRGSDGACRTLIYGAVVVQAGYGLISIGNASFARYTVVFDPVVILILVTGAVLAGRYVFADKSAP